MVTAVFNGEKVANAYGLWQWDYGQVLRIQGLSLDPAVEIHFSLSDKTGESITRIGVTKDGVTEVVIPESMLENSETRQNYNIYAWIYLADESSGETIRKIVMSVTSRPKPEAFQAPEDTEIFRDAIKAVNDSAKRSAESERQAEGWAHGRVDLPERAQDNAKYYAGQAAADAKKTGEDRKEVERLVESVSGIDQQVSKVEDLTKQAQTSATNAALSERAAKTAEINAQTAQVGAEIAEGNAELAERNAKVSEQAVEKAKQLVSQMGQDVLDNKNHVEQTVHNFDLTTQQALADVNNAGQTQIDRVQSAGETAVENIQIAQNTATKAVETAKAEAVEVVQTEGTIQTGNVTKEGEKQIQAVQTAAQEIVADREQIQQNKAGIEALKQGKADAIIDTSSGEYITLTDSDAEPFRGMRIFGKSIQDGTPSVENPVPIVNTGDKGTIEVGVTGKNLFNIEKYLTDNGVSFKKEDDFYVCKIVNGMVFTNPYVFSDKDIHVSVSVMLQNITSKNIRIDILNSNGSIVKTLNERGRIDTAENIVASKVRINFTEPGEAKIFEPQIEKNKNVTPYEPYREPQTLTLSTSNGLPGIKVDKDGNYTDSNGQQWVCDEIDLERGKYVQRIYQCKKGDFQIFKWPSNNEFFLMAGNNVPEPIINKKYNLCSVSSNYTPGWENKSDSHFWTQNEGHRIIIALGLKYCNSEAEMQKVLDTGVDFCYIMKTPIERDLTQEEISSYKALHTNYPTTVISNDESAHMEVSYVADTKNYIAKVNEPLQKQITELQKVLISQKISGGGIKVSDSANVPVVKFGMWGKTEQVQTNGKNLWDNEAAMNFNYWNGGKSYKHASLNLKPNTTYTLSVDQNNMHKDYKQEYIDNFAFYIGETEDVASPNRLFGNSKTEQGNVLKKYIFTTSDKQYYFNLFLGSWKNEQYLKAAFTELLKNMMLIEGVSELPYEPYTGGKPSPSLEYPQPIEVIDRPITITIKGGTEQQSITLVPPRPFTKWDKLEKIDGVWQWVYQSKKYTITGDESFVTGGNDYFAGTSMCCYIIMENTAYHTAASFMNRLRGKNLIWSVPSEIGYSLNSDQLHIRLPYEILGSKDTDTIEEKKRAYVNFMKQEYDTGNPFEIFYKTNNVEHIPLSQSEQDKLNSLTMYALTTELTNDGGCTMELTYTVDTKSYVDTKIAEISTAIVQKGI